MPRGPVAGPAAPHRRRHGPAVQALAAIIAVGASFATHSADGPAVPAMVAGGGAFALPRWTIDGGGGRSDGGPYAIHGTLGQPDADPLQPSSGGAFAVSGGLWPGLAPAVATEFVFADGFE